MHRDDEFDIHGRPGKWTGYLEDGRSGLTYESKKPMAFRSLIKRLRTLANAGQKRRESIIKKAKAKGLWPESAKRRARKT